MVFGNKSADKISKTGATCGTKESENEIAVAQRRAELSVAGAKRSQGATLPRRADFPASVDQRLMAQILVRMEPNSAGSFS